MWDQMLFLCDDRFIFVFASAARSWRGKCPGPALAMVHVIIDVDLLWVYGAHRAFEERGLYRETVISLTRGEPDSQLSPLKIGFLSPEIRIRLPPLYCSSIRKTCRPLRPPRNWQRRLHRHLSDL